MQRAQAILGLFDCDELESDLKGDHLPFGEVLRHAMDSEVRIDFDVTVVLD